MIDATVTSVLVGIDFDEASAAALKMAGALATSKGAALSVFHAVSQDAPAYFTTAQIDQLEEARRQGRAAIAGQVRAFARLHAAGEINVVIGEAPASEAIVRMAPQFDLIVIGTHRRHGLHRWWLGSVAESIVRHSPRPVLVVPADRLDEADVLVLPVPVAPAGRQLGELAHVLKECRRPVLFVPDDHPLERTTS